MITGVMFFQNNFLERYTIQNIKVLFKSILFLKNYYIKDKRIRRTYSGRKRRATGYLYLKYSPYRDAEGFSQLRSCIHDAIINAAPIIGEKWTNLNIIDSAHIEE